MENKEIRELAILITKKITNRISAPESIIGPINLYDEVFYADSSEDEGFRHKKHLLEFMTKHGALLFAVSKNVYNDIKIDSMGTLRHQKGHFLDFEFDKIATKDDVSKLNW